MFDGITLVNIGNDKTEDFDFMVAVRDMSEQMFESVKEKVVAAAEEMTAYDSMEYVVGAILNDSGLVWELVCADRFITVD